MLWTNGYNDRIDSPFAKNTPGGMKYQIEHHLFPSVNSAHYAEIAPIVKATAAEFGIAYRTTPSVFHILKVG